ncbi:MAG: hypothetical protein IT581_12050 [Verrucomicrobiales bacterium]|nr:hypothetical protein [Verrucomicrobiales bacterium]
MSKNAIPKTGSAVPPLEKPRPRWINDRVQGIAGDLADLEEAITVLENRCDEIATEPAPCPLTECGKAVEQPMSQHEVELAQIGSRVSRSTARIQNLLNRLRI